jgi:hypothetical protein
MSSREVVLMTLPAAWWLRSARAEIRSGEGGRLVIDYVERPAPE